MITLQESTTAKLCAFARAHHSNFVKHKIFADYLAFDLMGFDGYMEMAEVISANFQKYDNSSNNLIAGNIRERAGFVKNLATYISPIPLTRIDFTERLINRFAKRTKGRVQYVILGAGMDTFAFRNPNENIRVFEVDHPDTQKFKLARVKELEWQIPSGVNFVPVRFGEDSLLNKLKEYGLDPSVPTVFSILGVTYYLSLDTFKETLLSISSLAREGNMVVFDFPDETTFDSNAVDRVRTLAEITDTFGEPMIHGFRVDEIREALNEAGFAVVNHLTPRRIEHHYFRDRTDGLHAFENIHLISGIYRRGPETEEDK